MKKEVSTSLSEKLFTLPVIFSQHQTLPFDNLELSEEEQDALVAYLETLTDSKVAENPVGSLVN